MHPDKIHRAAIFRKARNQQDHLLILPEAVGGKTECVRELHFSSLKCVHSLLHRLLEELRNPLHSLFFRSKMRQFHLILVKFKQPKDFPLQAQLPLCAKLHLYFHLKLLPFLFHKCF